MSETFVLASVGVLRTTVGDAVPGEGEMDGEVLTLGEMEGEMDGEVLTLGEMEGEIEGEVLALGEIEGEVDFDGEVLSTASAGAYKIVNLALVKGTPSSKALNEVSFPVEPARLVATKPITPLS